MNGMIGIMVEIDFFSELTNMQRTYVLMFRKLHRQISLRLMTQCDIICQRIFVIRQRDKCTNHRYEMH